MGPAKTEVKTMVLRQLDALIVFDPESLAGQLRCRKEDLPKNVSAFVKEYPDWNMNLKAPSGFMVSARITEESALTGFAFATCEDIRLQILVFGSTSGSLYIPGRTPTWDPDKFEKTLLFLKSEVYS